MGWHIDIEGDRAHVSHEAVADIGRRTADFVALLKRAGHGVGKVTYLYVGTDDLLNGGQAETDPTANRST